MSNAQLPTRVLRPQADGSFLVLIDTYDVGPDLLASQLAEAYGFAPEPWTGRRPLGAPVAVIVPSAPTYVGTGGAPFQMFELKGDGSRRFLTDGYDPKGLATRLADGEFDDDFRFEYVRNPEPDSPSDLYIVRTFATPSQQETDHFTTEDPGAVIESARYCQAVPLEERWAEDARREAEGRRSDLEPDITVVLEHPQRSSPGLLGIGAVLASPEAGELYDRQQRALTAAADALVSAFPRNEQYARTWAEAAVQAYLQAMED